MLLLPISTLAAVLRRLVQIKQSPHAGRVIRWGLGAAALAGAAAMTFGPDTGLLGHLSKGGTAMLEERLPINSALAANEPGRPFRSSLPVKGQLPSFDGAVEWLNSPALTGEQLRGKVVLIDFWTYSCINCIRTLPYIQAWAKKYKDQGLVVIGVHTPEFAFEKKIANVRRAVSDFKIAYPVAVDNDFNIWRAFDNSYWPALYFVDAKGQIRHQQFGEGNYEKSEKVIQELLREQSAEPAKVMTDAVSPAAKGAEAAPDLRNLRSGETYLGSRQTSNFVSPQVLKAGAAQDYSVGAPRLNEWGLAGNWTVDAEQATLNQPGGGIVYRFSARDLHLVLGSGADGQPVRFQVKIDGKAPGASHGADINADGNGTVTATRLYQLVRQEGRVEDRTFEIRFLDPGVEAFVFTFG